MPQSAAPRYGAGAGRPIDGLTPDQRFFISYAMLWRSQYRTEALLDALRTDSHSPRDRVLGPLANVSAFATAFGCAPAAPMQRTPADRITIW